MTLFDVAYISQCFAETSFENFDKKNIQHVFEMTKEFFVKKFLRMNFQVKNISYYLNGMFRKRISCQIIIFKQQEKSFDWKGSGFFFFCQQW